MTGKDDSETHVVGRVWENTRMTGEIWQRIYPVWQEKDVMTHVYMDRALYVS